MLSCQNAIINFNPHIAHTHSEREVDWISLGQQDNQRVWSALFIYLLFFSIIVILCVCVGMTLVGLDIDTQVTVFTSNNDNDDNDPVKWVRLGVHVYEDVLFCLYNFSLIIRVRVRLVWYSA